MNMKLLFTSRYVEAFAKSLVVFSIVHQLVVVALAIKGNVGALNVFAMLNFQAIVPGLDRGVQYFVLSYCFAFVVYGFVFLYWTKNRKKR